MRRIYWELFAATIIAIILLAVICAVGAHASGAMPRPEVTKHRYLNPACEGLRCADWTTGEIWIGKRPHRFAISHEIGHIFDGQVLSDEDREWFTDALDFEPGTPWQTGDVREGTPSGGPMEHFADAYAACDLGLHPDGVRRGRAIYSDWISAYGYMPTATQHRRICRRIAEVGIGAGLKIRQIVRGNIMVRSGRLGNLRHSSAAHL